MKKLTQKEEAFLHYKLLGDNGKEAAIKAGYSEDSANVIAAQVLAKPHIKTIHDQNLAKLSQEREKYRAWALQKLGYAANTCIPEDGAPLQGEMVRAGTGAINEINKMLGNHAPTKNVNTNLNANVEISKEEFDYVQKLMIENDRDY